MKGLNKSQITFKYCLMSMTEKWRKTADKGKSFAALLTDLSKALDFPHMTSSLLNLMLVGLVSQPQS